MSLPPRPSQVTLAAGVVIGGSVFLVLSVFDQLSGLRSLENREAVQEFLAEPPGDGLGLSVDDVLTSLRILSMTAAACATAMAILGVQALRGSRSARVGLSVLAAPLMVTGLVAGGFLAAVVAVAVAMLWLQPARDWYDGRAPRAPERPGATRAAPPSSPGPQPPTEAGPPAPSGEPVAPPSGEPRPYPGFGSAPAAYPSPARPTQPTPPPHGPPYGAPAYGSPGGAPGSTASTRRPGAVVWACALTWALSGLVAVGMVLAAVVVAVSPDQVMDELRRQDAALAEDVSEDLVIASTIAVAAILVAWSIGASIVAWFVLRGRPWAQVTLLVSAACAGLLCLLGTLLGSIPLLLPLVGCSMTVAMLLRPEVRAWFAGRGRGTIAP